MADGRVDIETRLESGNIRRDVQRVNNELGRIGSNMNRTARDMRNTMGQGMNGMVGDSEYYARKYRRAYGNEIGGLMHDMGGSFKYMSAEAQNMMFEMIEGFHAQKMAMIPFKEDQIKATYGFYKMAQASKDFQGTNQEFINQANEIGKAMKKSQDDQINANRLAMMGMLETMGVMNAMSSLASKTTKNLDQMKNPLYNTARPALALVDSLDKVARSGSAAQIALELHGPQASMKTLTDETMRLNSIMMGMPILAMGVGMSAYFMYGALHKANMELDPKYAKAYNDMIEKLTKALEPMRQAFTAVMVPVFNFVTKLAEMTIAFNEAHPAMARFIQGTIMLVPALMALMLPLGLGVGYFRGLRAILFALRPIIMPIVTAFATMSTPVWILAAAIAGLTVGFTHFYKTNEKFKGVVDGTIKSVKDFSSNLIKNGKELLNNAYKSDMVQNSIKAMKNGLNVAGQKSKEFGLNMLNMGKYLYETAKSGDAMNEWVGHLPEKYQRAAEGVGAHLATMRTHVINAGLASIQFGKDSAKMGTYLLDVAKNGNILTDTFEQLPPSFQQAGLVLGTFVSQGREQFLAMNQAVTAWATVQVNAVKRTGETYRDLGLYFLGVAKSGDFVNEHLHQLPINMIQGTRDMGVALAEFRSNITATFPMIEAFINNMINLGKYILEVVTTGNIMNGWLNEFTGNFANVALVIGKVIEMIKVQFAGLIESIKAFFAGDTSQLGTIVAQILPMVIGLIMGGLPALIILVSRIFPMVAEAMRTTVPALLESIGNWLLEILNKFTEFLTPMMEWAMQFINTIITGITTYAPIFFEWLAQWLLQISMKLIEFLPTILQWGVDFIVWAVNGIVSALPTIINAIVDVLANIITTWTTYMAEMAPTIFDTGFQMLVQVLNGLMDMLPTLLDSLLNIAIHLIQVVADKLPEWLENGRKIIVSLLEGIATNAPDLLNHMLDVVLELLDKVIDNFPAFLKASMDLIRNMIVGLAQATPDILKALWDIIQGMIVTIIDRLPDFVDKAGEIIASLITGLIAAIPMLLGVWDDGLWKKIENILKVSMSILTGIARVAWTAIAETIKVAGIIIKEVVTVMWDLVSNAFNTGLAVIKGVVKLIVQLFSGDWKAAFNTAKQIAVDIWHGIEGVFKAIDLYRIGKNIIQGLINGISSMIDACTSAAKRVAKSAKEAITSFFDIHSPSRVMKEVGGFITTGLGIGIDDKSRFAVNKAKSLAEAVMDGFQAITEDIQMGDLVSGDIDSAALQSSFGSSKRFVNDMVNVNPTSKQVAYKAPKQEQQVKTTSPDNNQSNQGNTYIVLDKKVVGEALAQPVETTNNRRKQRLAQFKPTVTPSF
ncbi:carbamoyl-phosphate synthase large subunit [Bacillus cereus]|uniref:carbamoyl-phosphate synthase large subunit n=1 Tax=Bacillus cereus TaxID=1396 RepID=UPI000BF37D80|nr:carbamoyl-phosphate synthase large subunit [Bacillus cereus]PFO79956.1 carbamoyl-phosphate synthase large subunit [Bacillus cereus]